MKRCLLITALCIVTANAYALPIQKTKLISHTESIAPNTKFVLEQSKSNYVEKMLELKRKTQFSPDYIGVNASFGEINIVSGGMSVFKASEFNALSIMNDSSHPNVYKIKHEICVGPAGLPATTCSSTKDTVVIDSKDGYLDTTRPVFEIALQPGNYDASILTTVERDDHYVVESSDFRTFTVPA